MSNSKSMFREHSTDDLIAWRDAASERVNSRDRASDRFIDAIELLDRRSSKDRKWINKLNRIINDRAFAYKKNIY